MRLLQNCKVRAVIPWEQLIDNRRACFVGIDSNHQGNVRLAVNRAHLALSSGVAFPSEALAAAVHQALQDAPTYSFYDVLIEAIPDQSLGVYIVYEDKNPIYVGITVRPWAVGTPPDKRKRRRRQWFEYILDAFLLAAAGVLSLFVWLATLKGRKEEVQGLLTKAFSPSIEQKPEQKQEQHLMTQEHVQLNRKEE